MVVCDIERCVADRLAMPWLTPDLCVSDSQWALDYMDVDRIFALQGFYRSKPDLVPFCQNKHILRLTGFNKCVRATINISKLLDFFFLPTALVKASTLIWHPIYGAISSKTMLDCFC